MTELHQLPELPSDLDDAAQWATDNLDGLYSGEMKRSGAFIGGRSEAERRLASLDITGYAKQRNQVFPEADRGASKMSPYIRHGLISLPEIHDHPAVADAPNYDRFKYRGELLWQEYSRHWYAVYGTASRRGIAHEPQPSPTAVQWDYDPWPSEMECMNQTIDELHTDGWVVNQSRMWLASQWSVRAGAPWRDGEDEMFRHLLDGSRAANRLGWQWTIGGSRGRVYSFARRQVLKRAPEYCATCALQDDCPISAYPGTETGPKMVTPRTDDAATWFGPLASTVADDDSVAAVWLTAESLGDDDPALRAHPELHAHFVFDEPLLQRLRLDGKRLMFLVESLADLSERRPVTVWRGQPHALPGEVGRLAVTFAAVPGFRSLAGGHAETGALETHPFPWLRPPTESYLEVLSSNKPFPFFKEFCALTKR